MSPEKIQELWPYYEKASRLELIIRWFYGILIAIVYWIWGIWISIVMFLHFFYILLLGRRSPTFYEHTRRYVNAITIMNYYLMYLTDERPTLTPDTILHYEKVERTQPSHITSKAKFCGSCGVELPPGAIFCPNCGAKRK